MNDATIILILIFLGAYLGMARLVNHVWHNRGNYTKTKYRIMHRKNILDRGHK